MAIASNYGVPQYTVPLTAFSVSNFTNFGGNSVNFNLALSANTNGPLITAYLSGLSATAYYILSGNVYPTALSTVSATNASLLFRWPSIVGNMDFYGYILSSSLIPATSTFQFQVGFQDPNFLNTVFTLSANKTSITVSSPAIDNPYYDIAPAVSNVYNGLSSLNVLFITVSNDCRSWSCGEV